MAESPLRSPERREGSPRKRKAPGKKGGTEEDECMETLLSEEATKDVRDKYFDLMNQVQHQSEGEDSIDPHRLHMMLLQVNQVFEKVTRPREAAIDSQLLKTCGTLAEMAIESTQCNIAVFKPRDFGEKLLLYLMRDDDGPTRNEKDKMVRLCRKTEDMHRGVYGVEPFCSALEWERPQPQRKKKEPVRNNVVAEQQKVAQSAGEGEKETEIMSWKLRILKECYAENGSEPICFYSFAVDPTSYSNTVENLFHLSLLVTEMYVEVLKDEDGLPVIRPTISTSKTGGKGEDDFDKQCIISIDMQEWQELVKAFNITVPMITPMKKTSKKRK